LFKKLNNHILLLKELKN